MRDFLTPDDAWYAQPSVEVTLPRNAFATFALRNAEAYAMATQVRVTQNAYGCKVLFSGPQSRLVAALKATQVAGETIQDGSMTWFKETSVLQGIEPDQTTPLKNEIICRNIL